MPGVAFFKKKSGNDPGRLLMMEPDGCVPRECQFGHVEATLEALLLAT